MIVLEINLYTVIKKSKSPNRYYEATMLDTIFTDYRAITLVHGGAASLQPLCTFALQSEIKGKDTKASILLN